jgi:hypothetical protein
MDHIGIDLGSRESQVCVRAAGGEIVEEARDARALSEAACRIDLPSTFPLS